jgi:hypothetical protein
MIVRIAVGAYAALRAVLIYGEASGLATRAADAPRIAWPRSLAAGSGRRRDRPTSNLAHGAM